MIRFHQPGETVRFQNGDEVLEGICNGPVIEKTYVPVHVQEGNRNILVHVKNIFEWEEEE